MLRESRRKLRNVQLEESSGNLTVFRRTEESKNETVDSVSHKQKRKPFRAILALSHE